MKKNIINFNNFFTKKSDKKITKLLDTSKLSKFLNYFMPVIVLKLLFESTTLLTL